MGASYLLAPAWAPKHTPAAARRRRLDRFKRKLNRLAIGIVVTIALLIAVMFEAAALQEGLRWLVAQERIHVERVASERVAQDRLTRECERAP